MVDHINVNFSVCGDICKITRKIAWDRVNAKREYTLNDVTVSIPAKQ